MGSSNQADTSQGPKSQKPKKLSQKEQSERFIETARALGADESGEKFEAVTSKIIVKPRRQS